MSVSPRSIGDLRGPRGLPLVGNALQLLPPVRAHLRIEAWARRHGPMMRIRVGPRTLVAIADVDAINEILRERPHGFRRPLELRNVLDEMGPRGVFTAEGEEWRRQRRLVVAALNTNHIHSYYEIVRTCTERLRQRLREAATSGRSLHIVDELGAFTVDVASWLALGHDINTLQRSDVELQRHFRSLTRMIARRMVAPYPYWRHLRLPADRRFDRSAQAMRAAVEGFVAQARARMDATPGSYEQPQNLLEGMLAAQRSDGLFTDEEIVGNVFAILLAGEDTTAHTLAWTLSLLARRPEVQRRMAAEAAVALGDEAVPASHRTAEALPYTEAVLQESMRLRSVTGLFGVEPIEDVTICGTHIPAGTPLVLLTGYVCREAAGSSREFAPERWLADQEGARPPKTLSFGAGPRFCPGRNLALLQSKVVLAMLVRAFEVELDESRGPIAEAMELVIVPRGLRVRLHERGRPPRAAGRTGDGAQTPAPDL